MSDVPLRTTEPSTPTGIEPAALPSATAAGLDSRFVEAWCEWLGRLATDAEAALAGFYPGKDTLNGAIERLNADGSITSTAETLAASAPGLTKAEEMLGPLAARSWSDVTSRLLPGLAAARTLNEGDRVEFVITQGQKGPAASDVTVI